MTAAVPEVASELLDRVAGYLAEAGPQHASLRPMAKATGVSTYKLLYYFGSKEEIVRRALERLRERQLADIRAHVEAHPNATVGETMKRYWRWFLEPAHRARSRLLLEAGALALHDPASYPASLRAPQLEGVEMETRIIEAAGVPREEAEVLATLVCNAVRGLQIDLLHTGDEDRITRAVDVLAEQIDDRISRLQGLAEPAGAGTKGDGM